MMPSQTIDAIKWALSQTHFDGINTLPITKDTMQPLVDSVRQYFNTNNIQYQTFSYIDLQTYFI